MNEGKLTSKLSRDDRMKVEGMRLAFSSGIREILKKKINNNQVDKEIDRVDRMLKRV